MYAVGPDFVWQLTFVDIREPQLPEKAGLVSQGEYPGDAIFHRLGETGPNESGAEAKAHWPLSFSASERISARLSQQIWREQTADIVLSSSVQTTKSRK